MDLPEREKYEAEIAAILLLLLRSHADDYRRRRLSHAKLYREMRAAMIPVLQRVFIDSAEALLKKEGQNLPAGMDESIRRAAREWAEAKASDLATGYAGRTLDALDELRDRAAAQDKPVADADLDRVFGPGRAETISISEISQASHFGQEGAMAAMIAAGMIDREKSIWRTREDERVCPICDPLDGQPREVWSQKFPNGPGSAHVRCRCFLDYDIDIAAAKIA